MATEVKERLHQLLDALPSGEIQAAARNLEFLAKHGDPFVQALLNASQAAEALSASPKKTLDGGRRALETGDMVTNQPRVARRTRAMRHGRWSGPVRPAEIGRGWIRRWRAVQPDPNHGRCTVTARRTGSCVAISEPIC